MLYYTANPRDGADAVSACQVCCCETVKMRPGETNLMTINYTQWSVPMGWLMAGTEYTMVHDTSACSTAAVDGFVAPTNTNYNVVSLANVASAVDLSVNATPAQAFTFELMPFSGPANGTVTFVGNIATYTPANSFNGYDNFWYKMTDPQGRTVIRSVTVAVGTVYGAPPRENSALLPFIDLTKIKVNENAHTISFPVHMPLSCQPCDAYRMTLKQPARDCDGNTFSHFKCFDFRCGGC